MVLQGGLRAGDVALVHAVGSGVGTAAIQIIRAIGARSIGTARTEAKLERCRALGLDAGIVPTTAKDGAPEFATRVREQCERWAGGKAVDVVLDLVGGSYMPESLLAMSDLGRFVLVGLLAGTRADVDLGIVLRRRLRIMGTVLRARPLEEKILAATCLAHNLAPLFASGTLKPVIDRVLPLEKAGEAHAYMASNDGFGKLVLTT